jgi:putative PIN family toxin of toxin-antitoxin system
MNSRSPIRVFVDSDVIISSLISKTGAAYSLLNDIKQVEFYVSNLSIAELEKVVIRPHLKIEGLHHLIDSRLRTINISSSLKMVKKEYADYVSDENDAHIVAGAKEAQANFLVSYNVRHFKPEKLRQDFQIILLTPGMFLQYLRSQ